MTAVRCWLNGKMQFEIDPDLCVVYNTVLHLPKRDPIGKFTAVCFSNWAAGAKTNMAILGGML